MRMISEALELCVKDGGVSHSWCMCVVGSHGYGGLDEGRDGGNGWYACWSKPGELIACRQMPKHIPRARKYTDDTRSLRRPVEHLWVGSIWNWSVSCKGLNTGGNEKAPDRCLYNRLATPHGAPRTMLSTVIVPLRIIYSTYHILCTTDTHVDVVHTQYRQLCVIVT